MSETMPAPKAQWNDPRVQRAYEVLCNCDLPPAGEHWEGWVARRIVDALSTHTAQAEAPTPLPYVSGKQADAIGYVARWGGNCRDCADENGVCPNSGLPCGGARKAIEHVIKALQYGVQHGYIDSPIATAQAVRQEPEVSPVLVRDVADVLGVTVPDVCTALLAIGRPPRSTNMAVSGEELCAVAKRLAVAQAVRQEPVAWREHVEQRLRNWRQSKMNRSGDRLALDDYMSTDAMEDLIDYVCDEWSEPAAAPQPPQPVALAETVAWIRVHPDGSYSNDVLLEWQIEQTRRDSGQWVPLVRGITPPDQPADQREGR